MAKQKPTRSEAVMLGPVLDFLRQLWALDHALDRASKRMLAKIGITAEQRILMRIIGENPGISAGRVTELLHVDAGTTSASLRRLEERALVVRERDPKDGRRVTLTLTPAGKRLSTLRSHTIESAVEMTLATSKASDVQALRRVLAHLIGVLEANVEADG